MALVNRTTGETSRTEAQRVSSVSPSVPQTLTPPQNSSPETEKQILSWQTIAHMNKLELENSVLKESLAQLRQEMNELEEKQNRYFQSVNETLSSIDHSLSDYGLQVNLLQNSNEQLSGSLNASVGEAMNHVYNRIDQSVKFDLGFCVEGLEQKIKAHLKEMEALSKSATKQYEKSMTTLQTVSNEKQTLIYLFAASLVGHLIGCIQWLSSFF